MAENPTARQIGRRIAEIRKQKGYSQQDIAGFLKIPRSSVTQIESGNRNLLATEMKQLAEILGFSLDKILSKTYQTGDMSEHFTGNISEKPQVKISIPSLKVEKFKNILLYILERCGGKPNVGETLLNKLLYFADFNFYELYEEHMTGAEYRKLSYGPVPQKMDSIIHHMIEKKKIKRIKSSYHGYPQTRYIPLMKPDLSQFSAAEKDVIDQVIGRFSDWSASAISEYSHNDIPWIATEEGELIDYELAFYRELPYSVRTYEEETSQP